eukprot:scaffold959_cov119-Isochrysis_galbana.AAC.7
MDGHARHYERPLTSAARSSPASLPCAVCYVPRLSVARYYNDAALALAYYGARRTHKPLALCTLG